MSDEEKKEAPEEASEETTKEEVGYKEIAEMMKSESSRRLTASAGGGVTSTSGTWYPPSTATFPSTGATWTTGSGMTGVVSPPATPVHEERVSLPGKITRKVLIAFLDPDEDDEEKNVVWAKVLEMMDVNIDITPGRDGMRDHAVMEIELSLEDIYGNETTKS